MSRKAKENASIDASEADLRRQRLADALRANLKRRKAAKGLKTATGRTETSEE